MISNRISVLFPLLLSGCGRSAQLEPVTSSSTILAFGASLTYGAGVSREDSYPAVLARKLGVNVVNAGVPGEITEQGVQRLPGLLEKHHPDLVLISHGGNDILRKIDAGTTKANLRRMIEMTRENGGEAVLIAIPKPALFPDAAPFYEALSAEMEVPTELDVVTRLQRNPKYKSDAIHFNSEGYALMATAVAELLEEYGAL
ncbi:GDSL-type esterase/lipase family protein [Pseudomonadota bacterium]